MRRRKFAPSGSGASKKKRLWVLPALTGTAMLSLSCWMGVAIIRSRSALRIQRSFTTNSTTSNVSPSSSLPLSARSQPSLLVKVVETAASTATTNTNRPPPPWPPAHIVDTWMDEQRRIVVAATNAEYVDFCDNFAQSLLAVNVTNFVLIALDPLAYQRLTSPELSYANRTLAFYDDERHTSGEAVFGNEAFRKLTSTRPRFLRPFLAANYTVFYNDIDVVWRRNAWDVLPVTGYQLEAGKKMKKSNEGLTTLSRPPATIVFGDGPSQLCTCLMYLTPNAISLVDEWMHEIRQGSHETDQFAFIDVCKRRQVRFRGGQTDDVLVVRFDPRFPTGKEYVWTSSTTTATATTTATIPTIAATDVAVIVHNNWIKGKQAKLKRFQTAGLWHPSMSSRQLLAGVSS